MNVARTEAVDAELVRMIERRSRKGEVDPDELDPFYMESVRRYNARRREENRLAWCDYFERLAACLRRRAEEYDQRAQTLMRAKERRRHEHHREDEREPQELSRDTRRLDEER